MPKIRGVKPDFWTDDAVVELSAHARLLYIGLWNYACDNGHVEDRPKQIKMRVLPADDVSVGDLLDELAEHDRITRRDGWVTVPNLGIHQRIDRRYFTTCRKDGCNAPTGTDVRDTGQKAKPPTGDTSSTRRAPSVDPARPRVDGDGDGDGEGEGETTAAAAAVGHPRRGSGMALPGDVDVLRSRMAAHTALSGLRWDTLTAEQLIRLSDLIGQHGDTRLVDVALRTCRNPPPVFATAFLGTWEAIGAPRAVEATRPTEVCDVCGLTETACTRASQNVHPDDRHTYTNRTAS